MAKKIKLKPSFKVVGHNVVKKDGVSLVTGRAKFVADFPKMKGELIAKILYSPYAHARIVSIDTKLAKKVPGVHAVLTYKDVPRIPHTTAGQGWPEPSPYDTYLLDNKVRYVGDRVAVVAAETEDAANEALKKIKVKYKVLKPVLDPEKAMEKGQPIIHDEKDSTGIYDAKRNIAAHVDVELGDVNKGLADADYIFEGKYTLGYAQHCPIEPHIVRSYLDEHNRLTIISSTQVPYHARRITAQVLSLPIHRVRVIKPRIGGGFGTKQEVFLDQLAGMLTLKTGRPVRLELSRPEEFISSRTRHPHIIHLKTGVKKDGSLTAIELHALSNTGAYGSHALTVVCNAGSKTLPLYKCPNIRFIADAVYTNLPVAGAYRGYGGTQGYFALESQMTEIAEKLGLDELEFRKKNHIKEGESSPVFAALGEGREGFDQILQSVKLSQCIDIGAKEFKWYEKKKKYKNQKGIKRRGIGCAALMQGSGIPGIDMGSIYMKMNEDGSFNLRGGYADLGTGADTVMAQIAAEVLSVPAEKIIVESGDTDSTPFDVGAYASSTTYITGGAVRNTAEEIKKQIIKVAAEILKESPKNLYLDNGFVKSRKSKKSVSYQNICNRALYAKDQFQIQAGGSHISYSSPPPFAAHFAEVEVDTETGQVKVLEYVTAVDCGQAIHPRLAEGQVEGALLNGITYALTEELVFDEKGVPRNDSFFQYKIFTANDLPKIKTILVESYEPTGPCGAKSISEININGPIPAIANAINNAIGVRLYKIPFSPESILKALENKK